MAAENLNAIRVERANDGRWSGGLPTFGFSFRPQHFGNPLAHFPRGLVGKRYGQDAFGPYSMANKVCDPKCNYASLPGPRSR